MSIVVDDFDLAYTALVLAGAMLTFVLLTDRWAVLFSVMGRCVVKLKMRNDSSRSLYMRYEL